MFKRKSDGKIARSFDGMPASIHYVGQGKVWLDYKVIKEWLHEIWAPTTLGRESKKSYLLMDECSVHLVVICCDLIKGVLDSG
jgi:DDE superfamily endonuclease